MNEIKTGLFKLIPKDFLKAAIIAGITAGAKIIYTAIEAGTFPDNWIQWKSILLATGGAFFVYLLKNFLTNSDDKFLKPETK